jgi:hypothetical protein
MPGTSARASVSIPLSPPPHPTLLFLMQNIRVRMPFQLVESVILMLVSRACRARLGSCNFVRRILDRYVVLSFLTQCVFKVNRYLNCEFCTLVMNYLFSIVFRSGCLLSMSLSEF